MKGAIPMNDENEKPLKPYYVYELVDPASGEVFYVGRGVGERAYAHEKEAKTLDEETPKLERIRKIKSSGNNLGVRVIGRYESKVEASAVESTLIDWVYGLHNLTNVVGGRGHDSIRKHGELGNIEGIDIPEKIRSFDGAYSKDHLERRENNNIISHMEKLKASLEKQLGLTFSDLDISNPRFTKFYYPISGVNISLGTSHSIKRLIWIGVEALDGKKEHKNRVVEICAKSNLEVRNNGAYAKLPDFRSTSNFEEILTYFKIRREEIASTQQDTPAQLN